MAVDERREPAPDTPGSVRRGSLALGLGMAASNLAQVGWLVVGRHTFRHGEFGLVLAAQSLYGVLQIVLDNGPSWEGARLAASGELTAAARTGLVRARCALAAACIPVAVLVGAVGDIRVLVASLPYLAALMMFALLNVWEPLGRGRLAPYASYVGGRSAGLCAAVVLAYAFGATLPLEVPGLVECGVIAVVALIAGQRKLSLTAASVTRPAWRSIWQIGAPAVVSQYNYAVGTVLLGVTGRTVAAAIAGVGMRLVSGLGGANGVVSTAAFPRLARTSRWQRSDEVLAGALLIGVACVSALAVAVGLAIAAPLAHAFLGHSPPSSRVSLVIALAGGAGAAVTVQLVFVLVAARQERAILRASLTGAAVLSGGAIAGALSSDGTAAVIVCAGFAVGQAVTAVMLLRVCGSRTSTPGWALPPAFALVVLLPVAGIAAGQPTFVRLPAAAVVTIVACVAAAIAWRHATARDPRPADLTDGERG